MATDFTEFRLRFGGDENDINAATYGVLLVNAVTLVEEANKEMRTGAHLEIRVKAQRQGSFLVDLGIEPAQVTQAVAPLITSENIALVKSVASGIIQTVSAALKLKKDLSGEKPQKVVEAGEQITITTHDKSTVTINKQVYNLAFVNPRSQSAIEDAFKTLSEDSAVTDFAVLDEKDETLFEANRSEFPTLSKSIAAEPQQRQTLVETTHLHIIRQSFDPKFKSDYMYRGFKIMAHIKDKNFWERVEMGERFGKGDMMLVELEIEQEFSKSLNTYENKAHNVIRVINHIPRQSQPTLFDGEPAKDV